MRRWFLWTFRCHRGKRCPNLVLDEFTAKRLAEGEEDVWEPLDDKLVAGGLVYFDYTCADCGTRYRGSSMVGHEGSFTATTRERLRV